MIRKLRIKIVIVITLILTCAVFAIMAAVNIMERAGISSQIESDIKRIADADGFLPSDYDSFDPYKNQDQGITDFFSIQVDHFYNVRKIVIARDIVVQQDDILNYAQEALSSGQSFGEMGRYAFYIQNKYYGKIIVFMDIKSFQQAQDNLLFNTTVIGLLTVIFFFFLAVLLSFWLVRPVKETFDKQKSFISNASHELKTPLAVISANTDVLEAQTGENKWVGYIRSETKRMNELVNELLCLARLDDKTGHKLIMSEFNLSDTFLQT